MPDELPTEWDNAIGPNGIPRINITAPVGDYNTEGVPSYQPQLPVKDVPQHTSYIIEPDLTEAQQGKVDLPPDVAINDAGIPFNKKTGKEIPIIQRPNVLPVAKTPDGYTFAWPKLPDIVGNVMAPLAAPAVATKAGEVVLGSGAVRTMPEVAKAAEPTGPFYSTLAQAVDNSKINKATPDQWLGYLKNQPGVKAEEINTVLKDLPEGPITKDELQGIVNQNGVKLSEVVKGGDNLYGDNANIALNEYRQELLNKYGNGIRNKATPDELAKYDDLQRRAELPTSGNPTKFSNWQLPGGSNYQEMLMTLPEKKISDDELLKSANYFGYGKRFKDLPQNIQNDYLNSIKSNKENPLNFKSSHWDEPNVLAHVRYNDRNVPETGYSVMNTVSGNKSQVFATKDEAQAYRNNLPENLQGKTIEIPDTQYKKSLHLEEIQSDWHQAGRKQGYKLSDARKADLDNIENKLTSKLTEAEIGNPDIDNVLKVATDKKIITPEEAKNYKDYTKGENSNIPDAPFKTSWPDLAFKRMLHKAATEGYDAVSWTPGEAQAARYDLSKQVNLLSVNKQGDGKFNVYLEGKDGQPLFRRNGDNGWSDHGQKTMTIKELEDTVGKEVAKKAIEGKPNKEGWVDVRDKDLKIGGEGMKSFYDKMLVDKANSLAKKYGGKVESREIVSDKEGWHITPPNQTVSGKWMVKSSDYNSKGLHFDTKAEAEAALAEKQSKQPIHVLKLTPELKARAKQGFPLFASTPVLNPVDFDPFNQKQQSNYKLTPVQGNPFNE